LSTFQPFNLSTYQPFNLSTTLAKLAVSPDAFGGQLVAGIPDRPRL